MKKKAIMILGIEVLFLMMLYRFINSDYLEKIPLCWIHRNTGILCPSCGGTRCVIYMLQGKWGQAFLSHMIFFIGIVYLVILNMINLINLDKEKKIATWLYPKYWYVIIFAVALIIYTIIRNLL